MRSIEEKSCYNLGTAQEISGNISFEFHKGNDNNRRGCRQRTALGKPTPSKWDDAQKWLVGFSRGGEKSPSKAKPRNSNADDRRLIAPAPHNLSGEEEENDFTAAMETGLVVETKKVDCHDSIWTINKEVENSTSPGVRSVCVRDMGTEMTPIGSQEPSRAATPIRATTPVARSPISSGSSTPVRCQHSYQTTEKRGEVNPVATNSDQAIKTTHQKNNSDQAANLNPLETRAMAWDEAERAKYMARYKREEVKIQAWENHEKRKAEMEMRNMEVKAERLKARAQERCSNKLAASRRIAEEKRANAEAKLNEKAMRTSERADYIRRTGHLPSSFSFKLPSFCW